MDDDEDYGEINYSPLSQDIIIDGQAVNVFIYEDVDGRWILEAEDVNKNSYLWNETFTTDQLALNEINDVLKNEGVESLFGSS
jgi:predicted RNA-binding protein (virulence factor B family)|tara:strand:+ start:115 stop:363 length:249 start_codon:yes stop_codon:yes gene_type:complete